MVLVFDYMFYHHSDDLRCSVITIRIVPCKTCDEFFLFLEMCILHLEIISILVKAQGFGKLEIRILSKRINISAHT